MKKNRDVRVLLVSPNVLGIKNGINRIQPGLGIMYLAAEAERRGFQVAIRDTALEGYENRVDSDIHPTLMTIGESDESIRDFITDYKPHVVAISVLFYNQSIQMHNVAKLAKSVNSKGLVIVGGNQVSEKYDTILDDKNIDFAMMNECDLAFSDFLEAYFSNRNYKDVPGLVYREGERIQVCQKSNRITDLNLLPLPARHLANMDKYFEIGMFHNPYSKFARVGNVMASRGCPDKCTFCTTPQRWGTKVRWRDPENVANEIGILKQDYGVQEIQFEDDTLTLNVKNLIRLCELIEPMGLAWNTVNGIRADLHTTKKGVPERMFKKMADSGCYQVCLGVETGNQRLLDDLLNKKLNLEVVEPYVEAARGAGLSVHIFLVLGFPGETRAEMEETILYAKSLAADSYSVSIYTPLPGTPLYKYAVENKFLADGFKEDNILFAKSNIKIDGFSSQEFEIQVQAWTHELNTKLKERDPEKFKNKYQRFLEADDSFKFKKHS